jgi:hypothetical protein
MFIVVLNNIGVGLASAQDTWMSNASSISGLNPAPYTFGISPTSLQIGGVWTVIIGQNNANAIYGYTWNETGWVLNASSVNGLSCGGCWYFSPTAFQLNGNWNIIAGNNFNGVSEGIFYGYTWSGTAWVSNSSLVGGLVDHGVGSRPTVFTNN